MRPDARRPQQTFARAQAVRIFLIAGSAGIQPFIDVRSGGQEEFFMAVGEPSSGSLERRRVPTRHFCLMNERLPI
jgi:hypothetical protein